MITRMKWGVLCIITAAGFFVCFVQFFLQQSRFFGEGKSKQPFTDIMITAKLENTLVQDKWLNPSWSKSRNAEMPLHINTINGIVYLTGAVHSQKQVRLLIEQAQAINGIVRVEPKISIIEGPTAMISSLQSG